jgi:hypothetical protein
MGKDNGNDTGFAKDRNDSTFTVVTLIVDPPTTIEDVTREIDEKFGTVSGYTAGDKPGQWLLAVNFKDKYTMRYFIALTQGLSEEEKDTSVIGSYLAQAGEWIFYDSEGGESKSGLTD